MRFCFTGVTLLVLLFLAASAHSQQASIVNIAPGTSCPDVARGATAVFHLKYKAAHREAGFKEKFRAADGNEALLPTGANDPDNPGQFVFSYLVPTDASVGKWTGLGTVIAGPQQTHGSLPGKAASEQIKKLCFTVVDHP